MNQRSMAMTLRTTLFAFSIILFATGCNGETGEPRFPDYEQVGRAVDALLADPDRNPPHELGPAVDEALFSRREDAQVTDILAPPDERVPAFLCGDNICVCAEGENIPSDLVDKWSCDGTGAACAAKGFIVQLPCPITSAGMTICTCKKPNPRAAESQDHSRKRALAPFDRSCRGKSGGCIRAHRRVQHAES